MSVIFLTSGDKREADLRAAIATKGYQIDSERSAFGDAEVCQWGITDPPCIIKLHDGKAVYELNDPAKVRQWSVIKGYMTKAVTDYDAAKAEANG
jgi:hypothetical protein